MARDWSLVIRVLDHFTAPIRSANNQLKGLADGINGWFKGIGATLAAFGVGAFLKGAIDEAAQYEKEVGRLDVALRNAGTSFAEVGDEAMAAVDEIERTTKFSGGEAVEALTKLTTMTGDYNGSLKELGTVADIAAYKEVSMVQAAELLGKAKQGNAKAFKEFGIEVGSNTEKLEQLRQKTQGFGEQSGSGINGWIARTVNSWDNFREKVGLALTQSDALAPVVDGLVGGLANLAEWIETNSHKIEGFVGGLVSVATIIKDVVVGAFGLLGGVLDWIAIGLLKLDTAFQSSQQKARIVFGQFLQSIGEFMAAGKDVLRKFGIDVGEGVAENMAKAGARMASQARADLAVINNEYALKRKQLEGVVATSEREVSKIVKDGSTGRTKLTAEELKEVEQKRKDSAKALEEVEKIAHKSSGELLSAAQRNYQEAVRTFQDKMQQMSAEDRAKAERLLKTHLENLLLKWAGFDASMEQRKPKLQQTSDLFQVQGRTADELGAALQRLSGKALEAATADERNNAKRIVVRQHIKDVADAYVDAVTQMGIFVEALGGSSSEMDAFITGLENIGDAIGKIAIGDMVGGLQSGIMGVASMVKLAFGSESASARAVRLANEKTQAKLEQHRQRIGDLIEISAPGRQMSVVEQALGSIDLGRFSKADNARDVNDQVLRQQLGRFLVERGMTMTDLNAVADAYGVSIKDDKGRLNAQLLQGLLHLLKASEVGYSDTFSGQMERIQQGKSLGIIDELDELMTLIRDPRLGIPALAAALEGVDETAEGRARGRAAIQELFTQLGTPGAISKAGLGGANESQFRALLAQFMELFAADETEEEPGPALPEPVLPPPPPVEVSRSDTTDAGVDFGLGDVGSDWASTARSVALVPEFLAAELVPIRDHLAAIRLGTTELVHLANRSAAFAGGPVPVNVSVAIGEVHQYATEDPEAFTNRILADIRLRWAEELRFYRQAKGTI